MEKRPFTEMFAGKIEVTSGNSFLIKIFHKESNFAVLVKKIVELNEGDLSIHFEEVMQKFFKEDELFVIVRLAMLRKKPLNLNVETVSSVFDESIRGD